MAPKQERRKRGKWEHYNADYNADENSQSSGGFNERQNTIEKDISSGNFKASVSTESGWICILAASSSLIFLQKHFA